jgi:hypothetical protein
MQSPPQDARQVPGASLAWHWCEKLRMHGRSLRLSRRRGVHMQCRRAACARRRVLASRIVSRSVIPADPSKKQEQDFCWLASNQHALTSVCRSLNKKGASPGNAACNGFHECHLELAHWRRKTVPCARTFGCACVFARLLCM